MPTIFATTTVEEGVVATSADVNGLTVAELRFPDGYVQAPFEPELPYLAFVLEGDLVKSFRRRTIELGRASAVTMPAGAVHGARFGANGARIVIVKPRRATSAVARCVDRLTELRGPRLAWPAWRLAAELHASDSAAPLAAEGLALELLAATQREPVEAGGRAPAWLRAAEELVDAQFGEPLGLRQLAQAVGVHPTHLARVFRARHGMSLGEYVRRLRLQWAARELASADTPLAALATQAGFSDQSHFTRAFRRHVGTTPGRYRAEVRRVG